MKTSQNTARRKVCSPDTSDGADLACLTRERNAKYILSDENSPKSWAVFSCAIYFYNRSA